MRFLIGRFVSLLIENRGRYSHVLCLTNSTRMTGLTHGWLRPLVRSDNSIRQQDAAGQWFSAAHMSVT
jgi:hypothetical protein